MKKHWKPLVLALLTMLLVCTCMSAMADTTDTTNHDGHSKEIREQIILNHHDGSNDNAVKRIKTWCTTCNMQISWEDKTFYQECSWKFTKTVAPTCTEMGYDLYTCQLCGQTKQENKIDKVAHDVNANAYEVVAAATCEKDGVERGYCNSCKNYVEKKIPATGHNYKNDNQKATCTEKGYTSQKCENCGHVINYVETDALGHKGNVWVINQAATCTEKGTEIANCVRCGVLVTRDIPATGHTMAWEETTKATCTEASIWTYTCTGCGYTNGTKTGAPLNHSVKWEKSKELSTPATCTTDGKDVTVCSACGKVMKEEKVAKFEHKKNGEDQIQYHAAKEATCTEAGNSLYWDCKLCGEVTRGEKIIYPALGHLHYEADANWSVVTNATCYSTGVEKNVCQRCGSDTWIREIPKKAHLFATGAQVKDNNSLAVSITGWGCTTDGTATVYCQYGCGERTTVTVPAKGHVWSDWTYDRNAPTCTLSMNATRKCVRGDCDGINAVETKQIAAAYGHSFDKSDPRNVAPTCTTDGLLFGTCTVCGTSIVGEKVPATGHNFVELDKNDPLNIPATCTTDGTLYSKCANCGETALLRKVPATGHKPVEIVVTKPSPSSDGLIETRCSVCGELLASKKTPYTDVRYNSVITGFGPMTRELVGGSLWNRVTPIDLSVEGTQTFDLIASNKYVVGTMTVTVANGALTVTYRLNSTQIQVSSEALKIYDNLNALRADNAKAYALGAPIDIASTFGEDHLVILSLVLTATYDAAGSGMYGFTPNNAALAAMSGLLD